MATMLRLVAVSAAAIMFAFTALAACSGDDDPSSTGPDASSDSTAAADRVTPSDGSVIDTGSEEVAPKCTAVTDASDPPTSLCSPIGQCFDCATPGNVRYLCQAAPFGAPTTLVGDASVPLQGCVRISRAPEWQTSQYCCPPAWVRHRAVLTQVETCTDASAPALYVAPLGSESTAPAGCEIADAGDAGGSMLRACCPGN